MGPGMKTVKGSLSGIAYLQAHLSAAQRATENGVPLAGYFVWSLMVNFEWSLGYQKRFGLVYIDYDSQR